MVTKFIREAARGIARSLRAQSRPVEAKKWPTLRLNRLEDRDCPAADIFNNNAGTGNWNNAGNWTNGIPTATSDVSFAAGINASTDDITVTVNSMTLGAAGLTLTLNGGVALSIKSSLTWNAGTITGVAAPAPGAAPPAPGAAPPAQATPGINLLGTSTSNWVGGTLNLTTMAVYAGAALNLSGAASTYAITNSSLINKGTVNINKSDPGGATAFALKLSGTGNIDNQSGSVFNVNIPLVAGANTMEFDIKYVNSNTDTGAFTVESGSTLNVSSQNFLSMSVVTFNMYGTSDVTGGAITVLGASNNTGTYNLNSAGLNPASVDFSQLLSPYTETFNGVTSTGNGTITYSSSTTNGFLTIAGNNNLANFKLNAGSSNGLNGFGTLNISNGGTFNWLGGQLNGSGILQISSGATLNINPGAAATVYIENGWRLVNNGTVNWTSGTISVIGIFPNSVITNNGTFIIAGNLNLTYNHAQDFITFTNNASGNVNKTAGGGNATLAMELVGTGGVNLISGTITWAP